MRDLLTFLSPIPSRRWYTPQSAEIIPTCRRLSHHWERAPSIRMIATAVYLFESDIEFQKKFSKMKCFCLPHYEAMLTYASKKMPKKIFKELYDIARNIESKYVKTLRGDVSWFCKKFDYRYDEEPWYNSKDSVKRSIKFLTGEILQDD